MIGATKYPVEVKLHSNELRVIPTPASLPPAIDSMGIAHMTPKSTMIRTSTAANHDIEKQRKHGPNAYAPTQTSSSSEPLHVLADVAHVVKSLGTPPASIAHSGNADRCGESSNFAPSSPKTKILDDLRGLNLTESFRILLKKLGTASEDIKDEVLQVLQAAATDSQPNIARSKSSTSGGRSERSLPDSSISCASTHDDEQDNKYDSSSEQEEKVREGARVLVASLNAKRNHNSVEFPFEKSSSKKPFYCEFPNCGKSKARACDLR